MWDSVGLLGVCVPCSEGTLPGVEVVVGLSIVVEDAWRRVGLGVAWPGVFVVVVAGNTVEIVVVLVLPYLDHDPVASCVPEGPWVCRRVVVVVVHDPGASCGPASP